MEREVHELTPHIGDVFVNEVPIYWVTCSCGEFTTAHKSYDKDWMYHHKWHWDLAREHWAEATRVTPLSRRRPSPVEKLRLFDPAS
jgi:hypothetical protein